MSHDDCCTNVVALDERHYNEVKGWEQEVRRLSDALREERDAHSVETAHLHDAVTERDARVIVLEKTLTALGNYHASMREVLDGIIFERRRA